MAKINAFLRHLAILTNPPFKTSLRYQIMCSWNYPACRWDLGIGEIRLEYISNSIIMCRKKSSTYVQVLFQIYSKCQLPGSSNILSEPHVSIFLKMNCERTTLGWKVHSIDEIKTNQYDSKGKGGYMDLCWQNTVLWPLLRHTLTISEVIM